MAKNEHVCAICCRPEVAGNVVSGENVKTDEVYAELNFEVASFSSFRDIPPKSHFVTTRWRRRRTLTIALSEHEFYMYDTSKSVK